MTRRVEVPGTETHVHDVVSFVQFGEKAGAEERQCCEPQIVAWQQPNDQSRHPLDLFQNGDVSCPQPVHEFRLLRAELSVSEQNH